MRTSNRADARTGKFLRAAMGVAALLAALPGISAADDFHYRSLLVGNRAAGMGGAYTAVSDDPVGLYYNPAGIVYTDGANVSASSNAFQYSSTEYKNAIGGSKWERSSSTLLPNFFGAVQPLGPVTVGLSYAVPDSVNENLDQRINNLNDLGIDRYVINLNQLDNTYLFGPSVAYRQGDFAVGMTLYGYYRHWEITMNQWVKKADTYDEDDNLVATGSKFQNNLYYEDTEQGLRPILGIMYSPTDYLSLGLTGYRTFVYSQKATKQVSVMYEGSSDDSRSDLQTTETTARREYPWVVTFGAAYYPDPTFMVTFDATWYSITDNDDYASAEPTWNAALGCEYYLSRSWALRGGLFTNNANTLELKSGYVSQDPHIDEYGVSFSTSYFSKSSSIELGFAYARGEGEDQIIAGDTAIQDVTTNSLTIFLSANYTF